MESRLLAVFAFLFLAVVVCDAALPSELYWNQMLLGTPMPKAVRELLKPGVKDGMQPDANSVLKKAGDQSDNLAIFYNGGKHPDANSVLKKAGDQSDNLAIFYNGGKQPDSNSVLKKAGDPSDNLAIFYNGGKQPDSNSVLKKAGDQSDNLAIIYNGGKQPDSNSMLKKAGDQSDNLAIFYNGGKHPDSNSVLKNAGDHSSKAKVGDHDSIFFLERDLTPGRKINVNLRRTTMWTNFLPRQLAEAIPFSTDKVTQIMEMFSIKPQSPEANVLKETIKNCEGAPPEGEEKHCATSLESMVDFVVYKLGRKVQSLSTEIGMSRQQYTSVEEVGGSNSIVCHSPAYVYPVFHCHAIPSTKVYKLHLYTKLNKYAVIAVCHMDTSKWNPEFTAFEVLNVKPGTAAVCHFLSEGTIVWTSDETST